MWYNRTTYYYTQEYESVQYYAMQYVYLFHAVVATTVGNIGSIYPCFSLSWQTEIEKNIVQIQLGISNTTHVYSIDTFKRSKKVKLSVCS